MIPLRIVRARAGWPPFQIAVDNLDELMPEACPGLDIICRGIIEGTDFVWGAEQGSTKLTGKMPEAA
jgi:hypothetical protein